MILSGTTIHERYGVITPFVSEKTIAFGMSYGLSHCGYDVRLGDRQIILGSGAFKLGHTLEQFNMPLDLCAFVMDKSTWARQGLAVQNTIIEPGWRGYLTLEFTNHSNYEIDLRCGMPIAQIVFQQLDRPVKGYSGKYQDQEFAAVPAKIEKPENGGRSDK